MDELKVKRLKNVLILQQIPGDRWFSVLGDTLVIDIESLASIIKFLVKNNYLSRKVLEGILSELKE